MADEKGGIPSAFWKGAAGAVGAAATVWVAGWFEPFWKYCVGYIAAGWSHLMASSQYPNWSAYLVSLLALISALIWAFMAWSSRKDNQKRFNQFNFLGSGWRWNTISNSPVGLLAYCPECDIRLVYEETGGRFSDEPKTIALHCEKCDAVRTCELGDLEHLNGRVSREIDRLIRTGQWRQHVPESLPK